MQRSPRARLTAGVVLLGASLLSGRALALTLGEPRVLSQSASQWVIEVPLGDAGRTRPDQIQARLAPRPAWLAAGLTHVDPQTVRIGASPETGAVRIELNAPGGFVDLLIELQWPRGRLQRELGLLLDASSAERVPRVSVPKQVWVQAGDTASQVVAAYLDASGSMAQGLSALQQRNPDAFVGGNVNRLRAGAVLKLPSRDAILAIDPQQASEQLAQQIEEFAQYRAEIAAQSETPGASDAAQVATGKVQPAQRDKAETPGDRLTLSAPDADPQSERIAQQRQAQQTADRAAELNRNIQALNRLAQSESDGLPAPGAGPDPTASTVIDRLVAHPMTPWAAWGLVALLLSWVIWRAMRRTPPPPQRTVFEEGVTPLRVDFDLDLPRVDDLPPLPADLLRPPTPVTRPNAAPASSQGPGVGADPMAGLTLDLNDLGPVAAPPEPLPTDPWALRLALAQALWAQGLTQTARVLAREVAAQAPAEVAQSARAWLDERV